MTRYLKYLYRCNANSQGGWIYISYNIGKKPKIHLMEKSVIFALPNSLSSKIKKKKAYTHIQIHSHKMSGVW